MRIGESICMSMNQTNDIHHYYYKKWQHSHLILSASINTDHLDPLNATPLLIIRPHPPLPKLLLRHTYRCRPVRHEQICSTLVLLIGGSIVEELDLCVQLCSRLLVKNTLEKV